LAADDADDRRSAVRGNPALAELAILRPFPVADRKIKLAGRDFQLFHHLAVCIVNPDDQRCMVWYRTWTAAPRRAAGRRVRSGVPGAVAGAGAFGVTPVAVR